MRLERRRAISLRKNGKSYNEINKILGVPKSTLAYWFKGLNISRKVEKEMNSKARDKWAENIIKYNKKRACLAQENRKRIRNKYKLEVKKLSQRELKLVGAGLYWAEGWKKTKWTAIFCNSDPDLIELMMIFFREICKVPEEKFRPSIQIHPNISEKEAKRYWSKIARLPEKQFNKTLKQVPRSSKRKRLKNTLPYGTFRICISDMELINKIKGWISGLGEQGK